MDSGNSPRKALLDKALQLFQEAKQCYGRAPECFREALFIDPDYTPAIDAVQSVRLKIH
jgi:hypothetical protein